MACLGVCPVRVSNLFCISARNTRCRSGYSRAPSRNDGLASMKNKNPDPLTPVLWFDCSLSYNRAMWPVCLSRFVHSAVSPPHAPPLTTPNHSSAKARSGVPRETLLSFTATRQNEQRLLIQRRCPVVERAGVHGREHRSRTSYRGTAPARCEASHAGTIGGMIVSESKDVEDRGNSTGVGVGMV